MRKGMADRFQDEKYFVLQNNNKSVVKLFFQYEGKARMNELAYDALMNGVTVS